MSLSLAVPSSGSGAGAVSGSSSSHASVSHSVSPSPVPFANTKSASPAPAPMSVVLDTASIEPIRPTSLTDVLRNLHAVLEPSPSLTATITADAWSKLTTSASYPTLQSFQSAFEQMCHSAWLASTSSPTSTRHALVAYWRHAVALMAKQYERLAPAERISAADRASPRITRPWLQTTAIAHRKEDRTYLYSGLDRSALPPQEPDGKHTFRLGMTPISSSTGDDEADQHTLGQLIKPPPSSSTTSTATKRPSDPLSTPDPLTRRPHKLMRFLDFGPYASFAPTLDGSNAQVDALDSQAVLVRHADLKEAADQAFREAVVQAGRLQIHAHNTNNNNTDEPVDQADLIATYLGMLAQVQSARLLADPHIGPVPEEVALARRIERILVETVAAKAPRDVVKEVGTEVEPVRQLVRAARPKAHVRGTVQVAPPPQPAAAPVSALGFVDPRAVAATAAAAGGKGGAAKADAKSMHPPTTTAGAAAHRSGSRPIASSASKHAPAPAPAPMPMGTNSTGGSTAGSMSPPTLPRMLPPGTPYTHQPQTPYQTPQQQQQAAMYSAMLAQQQQMQFQQQQQRVAAAAAAMSAAAAGAAVTSTPAPTQTAMAAGMYTPTSTSYPQQTPQQMQFQQAWQQQMAGYAGAPSSSSTSNPPSGSVTPIMATTTVGGTAAGYRVPTQGTGGSVVSAHSTGGMSPPVLPMPMGGAAGFGYAQGLGQGQGTTAVAGGMQQAQQQAYMAAAQAQAQMQELYQQQHAQFAQQQQQQQMVPGPPGGMVYQQQPQQPPPQQQQQ